MKLIGRVVTSAAASLCLSVCVFATPNGAFSRRLLDTVARPLHRVRTHATLSPIGYTVQQIRRAYGFDQIPGTGAGQIIAIIDAFGSPTLQSDLDTFSDTYGLPRTALQIYYPQGAPQSTDNDWALETTLDVAWAHAIAPDATIVVVLAKSASFQYLLEAVDFAVNVGARQISMSWGAPEFSSEVNYDYHFNRPGVTFFASSGDKGSVVEWPAASPYVVSVGGTTLQLDAQGNVLSETGWSGSGGGVSAYEYRPSYQNGWHSAGGRGVPDVSYNADPNSGFPVYIQNYYGSSGWSMVGGTSAGAPQWAAFAALVNQTRSQPLGVWNNGLYSTAGTSYAAYYRDIVSGSNGGFTASPNYDYVTGLGSPITNRFVAIAPSASVAITGSGFESPDVGSYTFEAFAYQPATGGSQGWTFEGNSGVSGNSSGFTGGNPSAPEGKQVAFLQMYSAVVSQNLNFPVSGNYRLTLSTALRAQWNEGYQTIQVYLDSNYIGSFAPSGASFESVSLPFSIGQGAHVLSFRGTATTDATAFIDNVAVTAQP